MGQSKHTLQSTKVQQNNGKPEAKTGAAAASSFTSCMCAFSWTAVYANTLRRTAQGSAICHAVPLRTWQDDNMDSISHITKLLICICVHML
jgi:hypothetical protein